MTLPSEILRICAKDVRILRWPLAVWATLLAISTTRGLGVLQALRDALYPFAILLPITAAIIIALAVTADPAVSGPTFWGVHRQRPAAVAGAKGLLTMLLLACMVASHALVLSSHGLTPQQLIVLVARAALETGAWFLFSAALAACARDTRGWLASATLVGALAVLLSMLTTDHTGMPPRWPITHDVGSLLLTAVSVCVLAWTYRTHLAGVRAGLRTATLMLIAAIVLVTPRSSGARPPHTSHLPPDPSITIHADRVVSRIASRAVVVDVPVTYPDSSILLGATLAWQLHLRDGSVIDLLPNGRRVRRTSKPLDPAENLALWGHGPVTRVLEFRYPLDSVMLARVTGNLSAVSLALTADRLSMRRVAEFPASQGGTVTGEGVRLTLTPADEDGRIGLLVSGVWIPQRLSRIPWSAAYAAFPILALTSGHGGAVRVLKATSDGLEDGSRSGSWVLPGNETFAHAGWLVPTDEHASTAGTVMAIGAAFGGHAERAIRAPVAR